MPIAIFCMISYFKNKDLWMMRKLVATSILQHGGQTAPGMESLTAGWEDNLDVTASGGGSENDDSNGGTVINAVGLSIGISVALHTQDPETTLGAATEVHRGRGATEEGATSCATEGTGGEEQATECWSLECFGIFHGAKKLEQD